MIRDPTPATYVKGSFAASFGAIGLIWAYFNFVAFARPRPPAANLPLPCEVVVAPDTSTRIETVAAPGVRLRVPPVLRPVRHTEASAPTKEFWTTSDRSLSMVIVRTSRGARRLKEGAGPFIGPSGGGSFCPDLIDGHSAVIQTSYTNALNRDYYEVFAEISDRGDSVLRLTVTANTEQGQRIGLSIVRSLRFRDELRSDTSLTSH
jgi:hypothetical protein